MRGDGLGDLVFVGADEHGRIHVYQDGRLRYLTFGNQVEQSCMDLAAPARPVHVYTQGMLLALLLVGRARRCAVLGLGGGGLVRALRAADAAIDVTGIEQRQAVIDVARQWFALTDGRHCRSECADALDFLQRPGPQFDLLFADLYLAEGMHPDQLADSFLAAALARLAPGGALVLNQWASQYRDNRIANARLEGIFSGQVLQLHVQGGNIIHYAWRDGLPDVQRKPLFERAQALGLRLDAPLQRLARNLWRQNAERLVSGRFCRQPHG